MYVLPLYDVFSMPVHVYIRARASKRACVRARVSPCVHDGIADSFPRHQYWIMVDVSQENGLAIHSPDSILLTHVHHRNFLLFPFYA